LIPIPSVDQSHPFHPQSPKSGLVVVSGPVVSGCTMWAPHRPPPPVFDSSLPRPVSVVSNPARDQPETRWRGSLSSVTPPAHRQPPEPDSPIAPGRRGRATPGLVPAPVRSREGPLSHRPKSSPGSHIGLDRWTGFVVRSPRFVVPHSATAFVPPIGALHDRPVSDLPSGGALPRNALRHSRS